jgi:hypothetical protein
VTIFVLPVYSQTAAFGIPPDFKWIRAYMGSKEDSNPFATDIFDPLAVSDKLNGMYVVLSCVFEFPFCQLCYVMFSKLKRMLSVIS